METMVDRAARPNDENKSQDAAQLALNVHSDGAAIAMNLANRPPAEFDESGFGLIKEGVHSALHAAIQEPVTALTQLVGVKAPEMFGASKPAEFGSATWYAQTIGSGVGMVAPFIATERTTSALLSRRTVVAAEMAERVPMARSFVRPFALTAEEMSSTMRFTAPVAKSVLDGAIYGLVLTPSHDPNGSFFGQRLNNALAGGLTFGTQSLVSHGMMAGWGKFGANVESKAFQHSFPGVGLRVGTNMVGGGAAGIVSAEANSVLSGNGLLDLKSDEVKQSVASFIVTGGVLDLYHVGNEIHTEKTAAAEARKAADANIEAQRNTSVDLARILGEQRLVAGRGSSVAERGTTLGAAETKLANSSRKSETRSAEGEEAVVRPPSTQLVSKSRELGRNIETQSREVNPETAPAQVADFHRLIEGVIERRRQVESPREIDSAVEAVNRLLTAKTLEVPLTPEQRLGLAKQLLFEAANPKSVDQGRGLGCGPAVALEMAQYTNPGKHIKAIVDLITTGKATTASGAEVNLSREHLQQIDKALGTTHYADALAPDATAARSLERAAQAGVDPIIDGKPSYANWLGMMLYGNVRSQVLAPEGQSAVYVRGPRDRSIVEDTGERLFQIKADGSVDVVRNAQGGFRIGPGVESRDVQPMYDAITGRDSSKDNFVLLNTREPLLPGQGKRVLSARALETALQSSDHPFVLEIDGTALTKQGFTAAASDTGQPLRHVVLAEPAIDPVTGKAFRRDGEPLYNVIDTYGRQNDLIGADGVTAKELFEATRQPNESPRIEAPTALENVANFGEIDPQGVYRGRKPDGLEGIQELKDKGITLVIDLIEGPVEAADGTGRTREQAWADEVGVRYQNIKTSVKDFNPESVRKVFEAVEAELNRQPPGKVFIHCARGVDRTGTIAAMWRMTHQEGWTPQLALTEMHQFGWNGHTPSTQRMGAMVANPKDFAVRTPSEPASLAEIRDIGGRDNPQATFQRTAEAAKGLLDQPALLEHPELRAQAESIVKHLDGRAPAVVAEGITNVLNRVSQQIESGKFDAGQVKTLLDVVESKVRGDRTGAYDTFLDAMRDPIAASEMTFSDLSGLAELSANPKDFKDVQRIFDDIRVTLSKRQEIYTHDVTGISPELTREQLTDVLANLPPMDRNDFAAELSRKWSYLGAEARPARLKLFEAYLAADAAYQPANTLAPFKDLIGEPQFARNLDAPQRRRLVALATRESNTSRARDVNTLMQTNGPAVFNPQERALLLRNFNTTSPSEASVQNALSYANPSTMKTLSDAGKSREVVSRLLTAADGLPASKSELRRKAYEQFQDRLVASDFADKSSMRFQNALQYLPHEQLKTLDILTLARASELLASRNAKHIDVLDAPAVAGKVADVLRAKAAECDVPQLLQLMAIGRSAPPEIAKAVTEISKDTSLARIREMSPDQREEFSRTWLDTIQQLPARDRPKQAYWLVKTMTADSLATKLNIIENVTNEELELLVKGFSNSTARSEDKALSADHEAQAFTSLNDAIENKWSEDILVHLAPTDSRLVGKTTAEAKEIGAALNEQKRLELHKTLAEAINGEAIALLSSAQYVSTIKQDFAEELHKPVKALENTTGFKDFFARVRRIESDLGLEVIPESFVPEAMERVPSEKRAEAQELLRQRNEQKQLVTELTDNLRAIEHGLNGPVISKDLAEKLLGELTPSERRTAIAILGERQSYLSVKGLNDVMLELGHELQENGLLRYVRVVSRSYGNMQPAINTLLLGQATPGWGAAYQFHKATLIHNDFYRLEVDRTFQDKPAVVLIDQSGNRYDLKAHEDGKLSATKLEAQTDGWVPTGDQLPMDRMVLFDDPHATNVDKLVLAKLRELNANGSDNLLVPESIVGGRLEGRSRQGLGVVGEHDINFMRIAHAETDPAAAAALAKDLADLTREWMKKSDKPAGAFKPLTAGELSELSQLVRPAWHTSTEARLFKKFAELHAKDPAAALEVSNVLAHAVNYRHLSDIYSAAKNVHTELSTNLRAKFGADLNPENVLYVVMNKEGSGYLVHEAYRRMNAEGDFPVTNKQFVSEKDLTRMAEQGKLGDKVIVHLDDAFDYGQDSAGKLAVLKGIKAAAQKSGAPIKGAAVATLYEFGADRMPHRAKTETLNNYKDLLNDQEFVWAHGLASETMAEKLAAVRDRFPPGTDLSQYELSKFEGGARRPAASEVWPHLVPNDANSIVEKILRETGQAGARANLRNELYVPLLHAMPEYFRESAAQKLGPDAVNSKADILLEALRKSIDTARTAQNTQDGWTAARLAAADRLASSLEYHLTRVTEGAKPSHMSQAEWLADVALSQERLRDFVEHAEGTVKVVSRDHAPAQAQLKFDLAKRDFLRFSNTQRQHSTGDLNYEFNRPVPVRNGAYNVTAVRMKGTKLIVEGHTANGAPMSEVELNNLGRQLLEELRASHLKSVIDGNAAAQAQLLAAYLDRMSPSTGAAGSWEAVGKPNEEVAGDVAETSAKQLKNKPRKAPKVQLADFEQLQLGLEPQ